MRKVAIKSPYSGNIRENLAYLNACIKDALYRGEAPFAAHKLFLDIAKEDPYENRAWEEAALDWEMQADYILVYTDFGVTAEMKRAISYYESRGRQIIYRTLSMDILLLSGLDLEPSQEYLQQQMAFGVGSTNEEDARKAAGASP